MNQRSLIVAAVLLLSTVLTAGCGEYFVIEPVATTPSPTPTPALLVSAADLALNPWDCLLGYELEDPANMGLEPGAPFIEDLTIASGYVLVKNDEENGILSATASIADPAQRETLDAYLHAPESFIPTFLDQLGAMGLTILSQEPMAPLEGTGDDAMGMAATYEYAVGSGLFHIDVILFRRHTVAAYAMVVYPDESGPVMPATELAFTLDDLIVENLASGPAEEAAQVDYGDLGRALWRCPAGFQAVDPTGAGLVPGADFTEDLTIAGPFIYYTNFETAFGFTTLLSDDAQQRAFDAFLAQPETFLPAFMAYVGESGFETEMDAPMALRGEIGDAAAGVSTMAQEGGDLWQFDVIVFRRGVAGAFVVSAYLEGQNTQATVEDLAARLDSMIADVLAGGSATP